MLNEKKKKKNQSTSSADSTKPHSDFWFFDSQTFFSFFSFWVVFFWAVRFGWYCVTPRSNTIFEHKFDFAIHLAYCLHWWTLHTNGTHTSWHGWIHDSARFVGFEHNCLMIFRLCWTLFDAVDCLLYLFHWPIIFICHSFTADSVWNIYQNRVQSKQTYFLVSTEVKGSSPKMLLLSD